ncbi:V-type proton ATPase 16 kDa proteolipid subunit [Durusdinium trenchii]|uniref:V-type proton ATPase 16 kDa proteolipid subunit n=1 Tax=Durusdinium trenchii TaxID=1381693 RepID=A0ABP0KNA8_9DINO
MSTWQCGKCGFNNRPGNNVCGGTGSLGCKQPRPDRQVDLGSRALAEADMVQDLERRLLLESLGLDEGYRAPPPDPAIAAVFKGNQQIPVPEAFPPDILPPSIFTTKAATFAEPRSPPPAPTEAQSSLSPSFLPAEAPAVSAASGASGAGVEWLCRCGFRNRASNSTCGGTGHLGCSLPKHVGQIDEREGSQPLPVPSTGIWQCLHCGFRNRPTNSICGGTGAMGCSALRPDLEPREPENAPRTVPPVRTDAVATGAWVCGSCGFKNHAGNDKCGGIGPLGCKEPRVGPGQEKDSEPVKETEPWLCSACDSKNEGSEMLFCSSCQAPRRFTGVLKSIGGDYAFVACTETAAAYGRDVYVSKAILHHAFCRGGAATSGISVSFMIALNDAGQPNVRHLLPLNRGTGMEDHDFEGTVKYLSEEKGFGFVECQEIMDMYGGDAHADYSFLKSCSLGQPVTFLIRLGQIGGRPQVTKLSISGPPPAMLPATSESVAAEVVADAWQGRVLLLGEGDFTFASAAAVLHQDSAIDATTVLLGKTSAHLPNQRMIRGAGVDEVQHGPTFPLGLEVFRSTKESVDLRVEISNDV